MNNTGTEKNILDIIVYTDGSCINNGTDNSKGGWSFIIKYGNNKEIHSAGYCENITTNQRMEVTAVIKSLEEILCKWQDSNLSVTLFSDSQYVVKGINNWMTEWEKNDWCKSKKGKKSSKVLNSDLWKKLFDLVARVQPTVFWIKGHSGDDYNELCDDLASTAISMKSDYYNVFRKPLTENHSGNPCLKRN
jgi:ribonuclease HI